MGQPNSKGVFNYQISNLSMQETQTSDKSIEEDTDFDSFHEAQTDYKTEVQHGKSGTARLESCELVSYSDVPDYCKKYHRSFSKNYLLFEAELSNTDKKIKVICPAQDDSVDVTTILEWAGAANISELSGKRIPITNIKDDYYRAETFHKGKESPVLSYLPTSAVKSMVESDMIEFKGGSWRIPPVVSVSIFTIILSLLIIPMLISSIIPTTVLSLAAFSIYPIAALILLKIRRS